MTITWNCQSVSNQRKHKKNLVNGKSVLCELVLENNTSGVPLNVHTIIPDYIYCCKYYSPKSTSMLNSTDFCVLIHLEYTDEIVDVRSIKGAIVTPGRAVPWLAEDHRAQPALQLSLRLSSLTEPAFVSLPLHSAGLAALPPRVSAQVSPVEDGGRWQGRVTAD